MFTGIWWGFKQKGYKNSWTLKIVVNLRGRIFRILMLCYSVLGVVPEPGKVVRWIWGLEL
jgi:hypothetical protein